MHTHIKNRNFKTYVKLVKNDYHNLETFSCKSSEF